MTARSADTPDWQRIDTVLFDLDGTLLDLSFDNHLWREIVPAAYAAARSVTPEEARAQLQSRLRDRAGTLDWYCMDYWTRELDLDVTALHRTHAVRIVWLPGARETLLGLKALGKRLVLITNSHRAPYRSRTNRWACGPTLTRSTAPMSSAQPRKMRASGHGCARWNPSILSARSCGRQCRCPEGGARGWHPLYLRDVPPG